MFRFRHRRRIFLAIFCIFFFLAGPGSAHSPQGFLIAGSLIILIGSGLSGIVKYFLVQKLKGTKLRLIPLCSIAIIELIIMIFSQISSMRFSPERDSLTILLVGCGLYYIVDIFPNMLLLKENNQRFRDIIKDNIKLAALLGIIFPILLILLAFTIYIPLYILFGG